MEEEKVWPGAPLEGFWPITDVSYRKIARAICQNLGVEITKERETTIASMIYHEYYPRQWAVHHWHKKRAGRSTMICEGCKKEVDIIIKDWSPEQSKP